MQYTDCCILYHILSIDACYQGLQDIDTLPFHHDIGTEDSSDVVDQYNALSNVKFVFPNLHFTCNGTITRIAFGAALFPSLSAQWERHLDLTVSLWKQNGYLLENEPVGYHVQVDLEKNDRYRQLGLDRRVTSQPMFSFPNNASAAILFVEVETEITVQEGDMLGLSHSSVNSLSHLHVLYETTNEVQLLVQSHTQCLDKSTGMFRNDCQAAHSVNWRPIIGIEFTEKGTVCNLF